VRDEPEALSFATLIRRTLWTIVVPRRIFRQISDQETVHWVHVLVTVILVGWLDVLVHFYLLFGAWIFQVIPADWVVLTIGWVLMMGNGWLLCVLLLVLLNHVMRGTVKTPGPIYLASFYFLLAFWVISTSVDVLHLLFDIPAPTLQVPWLPWLGGPIVGLWFHWAWFVQFPWFIVAFWLLLRHVLRISGPGRSLVACLLAVVVPLAGRLVIEPLPNLTVYIVSHWVGWQPPQGWSVRGSHGGGWVVLITQALLMAVATPIVRWSLHRLRTASVGGVPASSVPMGGCEAS